MGGRDGCGVLGMEGAWVDGPLAAEQSLPGKQPGHARPRPAGYIQKVSLLPASPSLTCVAHPNSPPRLCSYELPWEDKSFEYPASLAPPLQILIDASNGAPCTAGCLGSPAGGGVPVCLRAARCPPSGDISAISACAFSRLGSAVCHAALAALRWLEARGPTHVLSPSHPSTTLRRRLRLRQQVWRAAGVRLHPHLWPAPAQRRAARVDQAHHVQVRGMGWMGWRGAGAW